jgi:uncharacterized membrane protein YqjE
MSEPAGRLPESPSDGFLESVGRLFVTAVEMVHTRLELIFTELQEGLEGLVGLVLWMLVALLTATLGLLFGGLALVFAYWDTHRVLVAALLMGAFLLLAVAVTSVVLAKVRLQRGLFATTLTELAKDRAVLKAPP